MNQGLRHKLIGVWKTDPADRGAIREFGQATLCFEDNGQLVYISHDEGRDQIILLRYHVEGQMLVTDQPSAPSEERTRFAFTSEGKLQLLYEDRRATYLKVALEV